MKPLILILFFIFFLKTSQVQNDKISQAFIRSVYHDKGIIYVGSIGQYTIEEMKRALNGKVIDKYTFPGIDEKAPGNSSFTPKEKAYINNELNKLKTHAWRDSLIGNSILVSADTVTKIFKEFENGWAYFHQHYGARLYSFSKPIFLRNKTLCIFYNDYRCDYLCGSGGLYVYVKKNGFWKMEYTLYTWIS